MHVKLESNLTDYTSDLEEGGGAGGGGGGGVRQCENIVGYIVPQ